MNMRDLLSAMVKAKASDLYLTADSPPLLRIEGRTQPVNEVRLSAQQVEDMANAIMSEKQKAAFAETMEMNLALYEPAVGRFRVNIYKQRACV
jgi:twitching motility protein PilU